MLATLLRRPFLRPCLRHYSAFVGPNEELLQVLSRYMEEEKASASSNSYKVRAYSKAIGAIRELPEQVRSVEQVKRLDGVGSRIAKRIDAYLSGVPYEPPTRSRKTLGDLQKKQAVSLLSSIDSIGPTKADALYDAGCRSLQDLTKPEFIDKLTRIQQINAKYTIGLDGRLTREQASAIHEFVTENVSSKFTILLCGDFRRGKASSNHISLLVLHPQHVGIFPPEGPPSVDSTIKQRSKHDTLPTPFASHSQTKVKGRSTPDTAPLSTEIISPLECRGLIAATIGASAQRWTGIIRIPERTEGDEEGNETRAERIQAVQERRGQFFSAEIYFVPSQCAGAASMALTGDNQFNVAVRKAASRLDLRLNEYGLWKWREESSTASVDETGKRKSIEEHGGYWELIASEEEEDILKAVGMEWVAPERRNFVNLVGRPRKQKTEKDE